MNTLGIEAKLAEKYKYKPLPGDLSEKYRQFFRENIPEWLMESGADTPLYTSQGSFICGGYNRIVVGDYGAFVEFDEADTIRNFVLAPGQEYRVMDERYAKNVKYVWVTINDSSNIKIYQQKKGVSYADYLPGKYYVSVHEVFAERD